MKRRASRVRQGLTEESVLFLSVLKWAFLATVSGGIVGSATAGFLLLLSWSTRLAGRWPQSYFLLPAVLFGSAALVRYLAPEAAGHGTEKVIEAFHKRAGKIPWAVVPVKLAATLITLAFGGSAGKEGPCAQIGAGLTSLLADLLRFEPKDRRKLVICGISAGFAAVFGTPISGAVFGLEVLFAGSIFYEGLLPSFIAGITAFQVARALGVTYFAHEILFAPVFTESFFVRVLGAGAFFGLCAAFLIFSLHAGERAAARVPGWPPLKGLVGGAALVAGGVLVSREYLGLGLDTIEGNLRGTPSAMLAPLWKSLFTSITLSFGGSGGIVTPIFFVGTTAGALYARAFGLDVATFAAIGMVSLLAGAANTPLAASIMAVELFGPQLGPYAAVSCVIAFLMTGHRSVYPSQILSVRKSSSISVETGHTMDDVSPTYYMRKGGAVAKAGHLVRALRRRHPKEAPPPEPAGRPDPPGGPS